MAAYAGKDFPEEANNKAPPSVLNRYFHNFCITIYASATCAGEAKTGPLVG